VPQAFATFSEFEAYLERLGQFHMDLGLGRMQALLSRIPAPQYAAVQIVGTNGKGSTAAFLESVARVHGLRTGLFTSPHFVSVRERVRIDGQMLPEEQWLDLANQVMKLGRDLGLTYFEFITGLAALAFAETRVDIAVWEAGLGGRCDATSSLRRDVVLFTPVGLDHTHVLGDSLSAIAADKAHALADCEVGITGSQEPDALAALRRVAGELQAVLHEGLPDLPEGTRRGLAGPHQHANARLALAGWRHVATPRGWQIDPAAEVRGIGSTTLAGRLQWCPGEGDEPDLVLDAAHNPHALEALARALQGLGLQRRPAAVIFTCLSDKDLTAMASLAAELAEGPVVVPSLSGSTRERARDPHEVAAAIAAVGGKARAVADVSAALSAAAGQGGPVLVCGSIFLVAEVLALRPACLNAPKPLGANVEES
jgi:dihydrofolate synthase/folylpolyglutamate synthase